MADRDRREHFAGGRALELFHLPDGLLAQYAGAVARLGDRAIDRGQDVAPGRRAEDLENGGASDFLGRDVLHLPRIRDRLKLADREEAVLAGVGADDLQRHVAPLELAVLVHGLPRLEHAADLFVFRVHEVGALAISAQTDVRLAETFEADHRARLQLLDDRAVSLHRSAGRAREQEQQTGVRETDRRFRDKLRRRLVFAVRVRDVDAHAAGSRRADLHVRAHRAVLERAMKEEDVPRDLCNAFAEQQLADRRKERLQLLDIDLAAARLQCVEQHLRPPRNREDILVADRRGGVDAVDDHRRLVAIDESEQRRRFVISFR